MTPELINHVASYLAARDLLHLQCVAAVTQKERLWEVLCCQRWEPWPAFRLTDNKRLEYRNESSDTSWQERYLLTEVEANRTTLIEQDLLERKWYLSFIISGIRGESRSDLMRVHFEHLDDGTLRILVPSYPPLPVRLHASPPPSEPTRRVPQGDRSFSTTQWLEIADFPVHFVTRRLSDAEWLVANENVVIVSTT